MKARSHTFRFPNGNKSRVEEFLQDNAQLKPLSGNERGTLELISDLFIRTSSKGKVIDVNTAVTPFLGYSIDEFKGKNIADFYVREMEYENLLQQLNENEKCIAFPIALKNKSGQIKPFLVNATFYCNASGKPIGLDCLMYRQTKDQDNVQKLQESREQFRALFEWSPDAIFIHDFKTITHVNQAFLKLFEYQSKDEILGKRPMEAIIYYKDYHVVYSARKKMQNDHKTAYKIDQIRQIKCNGTLFYAETLVSPITIDGKLHLQITSRDITRRKELELKLMANEEQLRSINDNSPDFIITVDQHFIITYANRSLSGKPGTKAIGNKILDYVPVEEQDAYINNLVSAFKGNRVDFELQMREEGTESIWYVVRMCPLFEEKRVKQVLIICSDISERKHEELKNEVIKTITDRFRGATRLDSFCAFVFAQISRIKRFECLYVARRNPKKNKLELVFAVEYGQQLKKMPQNERIGIRLSEQVINQGKSICLNREQILRNGWDGMDDLLTAWGGVPLYSEKKVVGIIVAQSYRKDEEFTSTDFELLEFIGTQMSAWLERERIDQEIRQFEKYFSVSMDLLSIANEKGKLEKINPKFSEVLGYSTAELQAKPLIEFVHPSDRLMTEKEMRKLMEHGRTINFLNRLKCKSGEYKWLLWAAAFDPETSRIYLAAKDITVQKETQDRLEALTDIQNSFIDNSSLESFEKMMRVLLRVTQSSYGFIAEVNWLAHSKSQIQFVTHCEAKTLYAPTKWSVNKGEEVVKGLEPLMVQAAKTGQVIISNNPSEDKRISNALREIKELSALLIIPLYQGNELLGTIGLMNREEGYSSTDLHVLKPFLVTSSTLVKAYKSQLKTEEVEKEVHRLADIVSYSSDAIISTNQMGVVVSWNKGAENLLEYSAREIIGTSVDQLVPPRYAMVYFRLINVVRRGKPLESFETILVKKNGKLIDVNVSIFPLKDTEGTVTGMSGIVRDIRSQREAEKMKENFTKKLELKVSERTHELKRAQQKLATSLEREKELGVLKSRFVSMVSHQFRTPLTVIRSNIGILDMHSGIMSDRFKQKFDHVYNRICGQIDRMTDLMNDVLTMGSINSGKIKPEFEQVDLVDLCERVAENYDEIQRDNRKLTFVVIGEPHEIMMDKKLIRHALSNLISNAFKYSQGKEAPALIIRFEKRETKIAVRDYGQGIPEADMAYLFDPFFRASNVNEINGTGLGLSIAKEYVELNHGAIDVKSALNKQTEFTMIFKLKDYGEIIDYRG